jgi:hypothetical protein
MNRPSEKRAQRKKNSNKINFAKLGKNAREDGKCLIFLSLSSSLAFPFEVLLFISCRFEGLG